MSTPRFDRRIDGFAGVESYDIIPSDERRGYSVRRNMKDGGCRWMTVRVERMWLEDVPLAVFATIEEAREAVRLDQKPMETATPVETIKVRP